MKQESHARVQTGFMILSHSLNSIIKQQKHIGSSVNRKRDAEILSTCNNHAF